MDHVIRNLPFAARCASVRFALLLPSIKCLSGVVQGLFDFPESNGIFMRRALKMIRMHRRKILNFLVFKGSWHFLYFVILP